jgi:choline-sulfatase
MRPTNVLFIFSDQHSRRVLGCYGNAGARTPVLDALAARGTRFARAYCQTPICVPSRASLATGRWAHAVDSWDNATPYVGTEARSWGHRLTGQGHRVTTIGKLHYRNVEDPSGFPDQRVPMHVLEGVGDLYGLLRGDMPVRSQSRTQVLEARAGESEYIRYDRAIAECAARWLREEATAERKAWCLFVGFVSPHFPLVVPDEYWNLYEPDVLPLPVQHAPEHWSRHPVLELQRRQEALDAPFDEKTVRNAMRAYYGLVSFLDGQVGLVLEALRAAGLHESTRVIYSTDHGEMLGEHGLWWKSAMYESAVAVPLIVAGPDVPAGRVVGANAMLVDVFPSILERSGHTPLPRIGTSPAGLSGHSQTRPSSHGPRSASTTRSSPRAGSSWSEPPATSTSTTWAIRPSFSTWSPIPRRRAIWRRFRPTPTPAPRASGSSGRSAIRRQWTGAPGPINAGASRRRVAPARSWRRV